ncbi:hypothetical protein C789_4746 [Microcystis aeruginosa FACHB-905 = DIANCHI905]|uniref:Uncharacterized protein n=1 Tax=Microcystis aeruginosa PCC 7806SL TaxID=1903187 RepID=A0AB33BJS9_MICA7|nr:hypothetical protein BH695_0457 [Microcystis aeruginosa PCC 7806SL]ELS45458.1 hypothetical protein C789_4746 [Microcystis aeruginosa FACHB-905 = DIANCHI905]
MIDSTINSQSNFQNPVINCFPPLPISSLPTPSKKIFPEVLDITLMMKLQLELSQKWDCSSIG